MNDAAEPTHVLLHGAGTGPWVWDRVARALPRRALALDVPSRVAGVTPDSCADRLMSELDARNIGSVILVLHSLAGVLAAPLVARLGSRLRHIVFVAAVIPRPGGSFVDALPLPNRFILRLLFLFHRNGLKPSPAMIRRELCNDLSASDSQLVVDRYEAEWPGLYLSPGSADRLPRSPAYIKLLRDQSVPIALQEKMTERLADARVHELDTGHLPMLAAPDALAGILDEETTFSLADA